MEYVYIVSIGISWSGKQNDIVVLKTFKEAKEYVTKQFKDDIKTLKEQYTSEDISFGLRIGNTFEIERVPLRTNLRG